MTAFSVEFYEAKDGRQPVRDFLLQLEPKMRAKVMTYVELLRDNGNNLREPYSKHIQDGIFELRTRQGSNITRVMYFFYIDRKIILTNGFTKKSQKLPRTELERALKYRDDYTARMGEGQ